MNRTARFKTGVVALALTLLAAPLARPQEQKPPYYEEDVKASDPVRTAQARELDAYVRAQAADRSRFHRLFTPDYSSDKAFEASVAPLRAAFARSIGYPPPGAAVGGGAEFVRIGEDGIGTYYRASFPVLEGVHAVGIYIIPKGLKGKAPLVIAMHGGGGSPEVALFHGGANYHDMVRGGVKRGYVVWAPTHLFRTEGYPGDVRNRMDERMRLVGTSLTAVEAWKITHSLDAILTQPEVDPSRVGMVGLSYGGYYTLVTPALDTRIRASVSSCYFGAQEYRYEKDELSVPTDFRFPDRMSLFRDPEMAAMICPRALEIQAGSRDDLVHREAGVQLAPAAAEYYRKLGRAGRFRFLVFEGGHEFHDETAWEWLKQHL